MRNRRQVHGPRFYSSAQSSSARWMAQVVITAQILAALWPSSVSGPCNSLARVCFGMCGDPVHARVPGCRKTLIRRCLASSCRHRARVTAAPTRWPRLWPCWPVRRASSRLAPKPAVKTEPNPSDPPGQSLSPEHSKARGSRVVEPRAWSVSKGGLADPARPASCAAIRAAVPWSVATPSPNLHRGLLAA